MSKILIVEDNPINMKLFADILSAKKYDVEKATDGQIAYDMIIKSNYDLIILDVQLPVLDGFSLLKKVKKENIALPEILIVSAFAMDKYKHTAQSLGVNNYITKPIDISNFLTTVASLLENKMA